MIDWLREHWPELSVAALIFGTIALAFVLPGDTPEEVPETNVEPDEVIVTHTIVPVRSPVSTERDAESLRRGDE